jgi:hypothetical protein
MIWKNISSLVRSMTLCSISAVSPKKLSKIAYNWHFTCLDSLQVHNLVDKEICCSVGSYLQNCLKLPFYGPGQPPSSKVHKKWFKKLFQPGPFYDTLLYLCPIPKKLSNISQNCLLTGLDNLPAQTCIKLKWFGKIFPAWFVLWHFILSLPDAYKIFKNCLQLTFHVPGQSAGSQFGR